MRLATIALSFAVVAAILYSTYYYRVELGLVKPQNHPETQVAARSGGGLQAAPGWQQIDRSADGFRVQMPSGGVQTQVPAYAVNGTVVPIETIEASTGPESAFAVSWSQNPPVVQDGAYAERILDLARDGALARTQTTLTGESRSNPGVYAVRDFAARNAGGGILSARLILAGTHLYMLTAVFPASDSSHTDDVSRFFNSFTLIQSAPAN